MRLPPLLAFVLVRGGCSSRDGGGPAPGDGATDATASEGGGFDVGADGGKTEGGCLPYDPAKIDCAKACTNFQAWCDASPCANPYCGNEADCVTACNVSKDKTATTNVLFGCAAGNTECAAYSAC